MVLLTDKHRLELSQALAVAALLACAGCILIDALLQPEQGLAFSHELHVGEEGMQCINCHEDASVFGDPGMPTIDSCFICHDLLDEEKLADERIDVLFDDDGSFLSVHASELDDEVVFWHLRHVEAVGDCGACHEGIEQNRRIDETVAVVMDDCTSCHASLAISNGCATCHSEIQASWMPETHLHDWERRHGMVCRRAGSEPINRCACLASTTKSRWLVPAEVATCGVMPKPRTLPRCRLSL